MATKTASRIKKKGKQQLVFAKDKKQAIVALVVLSYFIIQSGIMLFNYIKSQQPTTQSTQNQPNSGNPEELLAQQTPDAGINPNPTNNNQTLPSNTVDNANTAQDANDIYSQTIALQKNQGQTPRQLQNLQRHGCKKRISTPILQQL